jgi:prepilin-type processing-associated H-X9-DG protein
MSEPNPPPLLPLDYATPPTPAPRHRVIFWIVATLAAVGVVALAISCLLPTLVIDRDVSSRVKSAANLRSIGQAILMYCNDNNGDYPDSFATVLTNTDITSGIFVNPSSNDSPAPGPTTRDYVNQLNPDSGYCSYIYMGRGLNAKTVSPDTIVAREVLLHPTDGANMLFADGHVEYVDPAHTATIIAKETTGPLPMTMPSP